MTPHDPIDPADPDSKCKPDCRRCAELVEREEEILDAGPFGAGYSGSIGPEEGVVDAGLQRRIEAIERTLDRIAPGWRGRVRF